MHNHSLIEKCQVKPKHLEYFDLYEIWRYRMEIIFATILQYTCELTKIMLDTMHH